MTSFLHQAAEYNKTDTILTPPNVTALSGNSSQYESKAGGKSKRKQYKKKSGKTRKNKTLKRKNKK